MVSTVEKKLKLSGLALVGAPQIRHRTYQEFAPVAAALDLPLISYDALEPEVVAALYALTRSYAFVLCEQTRHELACIADIFEQLHAPYILVSANGDHITIDEAALERLLN